MDSRTPAGTIAAEAHAAYADHAWREADRLAALERYGILDTGQEAAFDEIAALAADFLDAPIALVNLIAADRQWFKAEVGVGPDTETPPLDMAICRHALRQGGVMVVPDLRDDPRFDGNPLVHGEVGLRFYAGALLQTSEGLPLGTVCVLGREPRPEGITDRQRRALSMLASQAMAQIELRRAQREAKESAHRQAFLLRLSDALRPLGDPDEIRFAAASVLGEHLGASRVAYAEDLGDGRYAVLPNYVDGAADAQGVYRYEDFGAELLADLQAGRSHVRPNILNDPSLSEVGREALKAFGIGASLNVPLVKDGRLVAFLGVNFPVAHAFTAEEIELVQAVVERTWDAVERARAEAALRVSEERHRRTLEIDTVGIVYFDIVGGVTDANDAFLRLVGYTRAELEAGEVRYENLTPREWWWRDEQTIAELNATGQSGPFEKEYFRRDGSRRWLLCAAKMLDAHTAVEFIVDVTERRRAESSLHDSEERLRLATEHAEVGFWDVEEGHGTLTWPPRVKAMFGISADQSVTMDDFYVGLHPDDRAHVAEAYAAAADPIRRSLYDVEYRTIGKEDGVIRWVAAKGRGVFDGEGLGARCLRVLGTAIDVTERKTAEESLRASEARLRLLGDLDDALREASTASEAMDAATELLCRRLGASRCAYADVDADNDRFVIRSDHSVPGLTSSAGTYSLDLFGSRAAADMRQGRTLVVRDVQAELAPGDGRETFLSIGISAIVCCPLVKDGHLLAMMALHQVAPRDWRPDEIALAEAAVDRCWAHVERVGAEARLRESEERLRAILETARDYAIFTTDPEGRIETWPRGAQEVFGWTAEEAVGQLAEVTYTPEDRAQGVPEKERQEAGATGQALNVRWHVRKDGSRVFIDGVMRPLDSREGAPAGFVKVGQDVTERRRADAALRESEAQFRAFAQAVPNHVWAARPDGHLYWFNDQVYAYSGEPDGTLDGPATWTSIVHQDDLAAAGAAWAHSLSIGEVYETEFRIRRADGAYRWFLVRAEPVRGMDGAVLTWVGTNTDIEDRRRAEVTLRELNDTLELRVAERTKELEQAHEQLRQAQKMEAMGQLTGGVAHDFNNLLTPILGSLDMLLRRGVGSERERRLMDGALQSAERAKVLVQRLLAFARRQPLQPGPVDLGRLVREMAELIASTSGPRIDLRLDLPADLPPALADANQLEMALLNLAVNARDAMAEGGTLTITAARESVRPGHPLVLRSGHASGLRPGHYLRLSVQDTGIGMDEETLARAVEPFFSTKGVGRGTGLGLSMVHGLAEQLGGGLKISSRPGQGTTVDLWLPISPFAAEPDGKESSAETPRQARGTALLVDDEDLVRLSTADMLMDLGYEVVEAASAEAALRLVGEGLSPELVVTDHLMPGMSGVDLARELRAQRPDLPVLIVSGYAEMEGIAPGLPRLTKPFRQADLAQSLAALMQET